MTHLNNVIFLLLISSHPSCLGFLQVETKSRQFSKNKYEQQVSLVSSRNEKIFFHHEKTALSSTSETQTRTGTVGKKFCKTIEFPSYEQLSLKCNNGDCVISDVFEIPWEGEEVENPKFCIKLYPFGGGHIPVGGLGIQEEVGVYLQYISPSSHNGKLVEMDEPYRYYDVTFSFQLQGREKYTGKSLLLEWKAGTRFVPLHHSSLNGKGQTNDFGAILLESSNLAQFLDVNDVNDDELSSLKDDFYINNDNNIHLAVKQNQDDDVASKDPNISPIKLGVEITIHDSDLIQPPIFSKNKIDRDKITFNTLRNLYNVSKEGLDMAYSAIQIKDARQVTRQKERRKQSTSERLRVGNVIVPLLSLKSNFIGQGPNILLSSFFSSTVVGGDPSKLPSFLKQREIMKMGIYPGVDYRILRIVDTEKNKDDDVDEEEEDLFYDKEGSDYMIKPIYNLDGLTQYKHKWPVRINESEIPNIITPLQYNIATALGAVAASIGILFTFFTISLATSLFFIPSKSMDPTLQVGDVLLVEKVTPKIGTAYRTGDVVYFRPPPTLQDIIASNGGKLTDRDLFVKRIAAVPGDEVSIDESGRVLVNSFEMGGRDLCAAEPMGLIQKYIRPVQPAVVVPRNKFLLLGDCSAVSVDGRVWGFLDRKNIVGKPLIRTWPISRMTKNFDVNP